MGVEEVLTQTKRRIEEVFGDVEFDNLERVFMKFNEVKGPVGIMVLEEDLGKIIDLFGPKKDHFQNFVDGLNYLIYVDPNFQEWDPGIDRILFLNYEKEFSLFNNLVKSMEGDQSLKQYNGLLIDFFSQKRSKKMISLYSFFCKQISDKSAGCGLSLALHLEKLSTDKYGKELLDMIKSDESDKTKNFYFNQFIKETKKRSGDSFLKVLKHLNQTEKNRKKINNSIESFRNLFDFSDNKLEIVHRMMVGCYDYGHLITGSERNEFVQGRLNDFFKYFPGMVNAFAKLHPYAYFSPEETLKHVVGNHQDYAGTLEGLANFVPSVNKAFSITKRKHYRALREIIEMESKSDNRNPRLPIHLAEELNHDYPSLPYRSREELDALYEESENMDESEPGPINPEETVTVTVTPFMEIMSLIKHGRVAFYKVLKHFYSTDMPTESEIKKSIQDKARSTFRNLIESRTLIYRSDLNRLKDLFQRAKESIFSKKVKSLDPIIDGHIFSLRELPKELIDKLRLKYKEYIDLVDGFVSNIGWCIEEFADLAQYNTEEPQKYREEYNGLIELYTVHLEKFFDINPDYVMLSYDKLRDIFDQAGKEGLDEVLSFTEDALEFYPTFFDVEMFKDYISFFCSEAPPSDKLKNIIVEVEKCRDYAEKIEMVLVSQIESQKENKDQNGDPLIELVIPDLFYLFRSQVEQYNTILGGETYFKEQVILNLDQIVKGDIELITLGCGTGVSELEIARAIAEYPECKNLSVYLTDKSENMVEEATFNFYRDRINALSSGKPKIKTIPKVCDFCNLDELKIISPIQKDKKKIYVLLGGTAGNFSPEDRQMIYNNINEVMQSEDVFITTCGTDMDNEHYKGENEARWLFYPLKILGIKENQIDELISNPEKYEFVAEEGGDQKRLVGYFTLVDEASINDVTLPKGTKIQMIHSERFNVSEFENELNMFDSHIEKDGSRAIAICYKK